jgi:predicted  nucleic acid-binding Zn-ribbon protein
MEQEHAATRAELERERERLKQGQESLRGVLERERDTALEDARAQAEKIVADARHEVRQLEDYAGRLRSLLADSRRNFVELVEAALQRLESIDSQASSSGSGELLDDLRPAEAGEKAAPPSIAGD